MSDPYGQLLQSVRVADQVISETLDSLDEGQVAAGTEMRTTPRFSFRGPVTVVYLRDPLDETRAIGYLAPTRNISGSGLGFLHSRYVHVGTECIIHLQKYDGAWTVADATVARCTHIHGNLHELGAAFREAIEPEKYHRQGVIGRRH